MADDDVVVESPVKSRAQTELARPPSRFVRRDTAACQAPTASGPLGQRPPPLTNALLQPKPPVASTAVRVWASPGAEPASARHFEWLSAPAAVAAAPRPSATAVPAVTAVVRQGGLLSHGSADASVARLAPYVAAALPSLHQPRPCAPEAGPRQAGARVPLPAPLLGLDTRGPGGAAAAPEPSTDLARGTQAKKRCGIHTWLRTRAALTPTLRPLEEPHLGGDDEEPQAGPHTAAAPPAKRARAAKPAAAGVKKPRSQKGNFVRLNLGKGKGAGGRKFVNGYVQLVPRVPLTPLTRVSCRVCVLTEPRSPRGGPGSTRRAP
jgi:hypothetical protein